jgi:hypothetical protein
VRLPTTHTTPVPTSVFTPFPDFLVDIFCGLFGYTGPTEAGDTHTLSRERHVEVDGRFADVVLGRFQNDKAQFVAVLEGKGTRDPLDRPFAGRRMSAVDQAYRYAINLLCDWIIVTSMRETRLSQSEIRSWHRNLAACAGRADSPFCSRTLERHVMSEFKISCPRC